MALHLLPALQCLPFSAETHLNAANISTYLPSCFPRPLPIASALLPRSAPLLGLTASASDVLAGGIRRTCNCFSSPTAPGSTETDASVAEAMPGESGHSGTRLIAQNIPWACTSDDVRKLFDRHGTVVDVELSMHNRARNRGLAFVTMASKEEAFSAINNLNTYQLDGRIIRVEFAKSLKKRQPLPPADPVDRYNVFVGNLDWNVRSRNLRELFSKSFPNLLSAEVIFQNNPRRPAGYGFVSFGSKEEAEAAVSTLNGEKLMGRAIRLLFGNQNSSTSDDDPNEGLEFGESSISVKE